MSVEDNTAVNNEVAEQVSTVAESAPAETNTPEVADDSLLKLLSDDDSTPEPETDAPVEEEAKEAEPSDQADETTAEEKPLGEKPLAPKSENRFQKLANEKNAYAAENRELKEYIESINNKAYAPQSTEELVDEGLSEEMAEVRQLKQQLELNDYNSRVAEAQMSLGQESERIVTDYPMFDPDSPEFDAELAQDASDALRKALIIDPNTGQIIGSHLSPLQIYKPIAAAYEKAKRSGQVQGQKATEKMLANVDSPTSSAPREAKKDSLLAILSSDD